MENIILNYSFKFLKKNGIILSNINLSKLPMMMGCQKQVERSLLDCLVYFALFVTFFPVYIGLSVTRWLVYQSVQVTAFVVKSVIHMMCCPIYVGLYVVRWLVRTTKKTQPAAVLYSDRDESEDEEEDEGRDPFSSYVHRHSSSIERYHNGKYLPYDVVVDHYYDTVEPCRLYFDELDYNRRYHKISVLGGKTLIINGMCALVLTNKIIGKVKLVGDFSHAFTGRKVSSFISQWDVSGVTRADYMFMKSLFYNNVVLLNWNLRSLKSAKAMFDDARVYFDVNEMKLPEGVTY
jgi:hypothetical protein